MSRRPRTVEHFPKMKDRHKGREVRKRQRAAVKAMRNLPGAFKIIQDAASAYVTAMANAFTYMGRMFHRTYELCDPSEVLENSGICPACNRNWYAE